METLGYIFGMAGLSFAIMAWGQVSNLKKEFDELKKQLEQQGILTKQDEPTEEL